MFAYKTKKEKRRKCKTLKIKSMAILIASILNNFNRSFNDSNTKRKCSYPAWIITTYAYAAATPNPIGVGQQMLIFGWLDNTISGVDLTNNIRFHNYQFTITKPDGTNVTQTFPVVNDPTSSQYYAYTPDKLELTHCSSVSQDKYMISAEHPKVTTIHQATSQLPLQFNKTQYNHS